jgi:hypothetical protein
MKPVILLLGLLLVGGCASIGQRGAMVSDGVIENPSLGFFGFRYEIPEGYGLYNPAQPNVTIDNELQKMTLRIYELNKSYHPRGNEVFYESFLMFADHTAFLLITVKSGSSTGFDPLWPDEMAAEDWQLMPLYNVIDSRRLTIGESRHEAVWSKGNAFERKGWYYSKPKGGRMEFAYEACKVSGVNQDRYILMGFSLPEHQHVLQLQMKDMMGGFLF